MLLLVSRIQSASYQLRSKRVSMPVRHYKCTNLFCLVALLFTRVIGIKIGVYTMWNGNPRLILHPAE